MTTFHSGDALPGTEFEVGNDELGARLMHKRTLFGLEGGSRARRIASATSHCVGGRSFATPGGSSGLRVSHQRSMTRTVKAVSRPSNTTVWRLGSTRSRSGIKPP
jgi:hypothetical protein